MHLTRKYQKQINLRLTRSYLEYKNRKMIFYNFITMSSYNMMQKSMKNSMHNLIIIIDFM